MGREGERERLKYQCVVASHAPPVGNLACSPGIYSDWELHQQHFATQSTEPHQAKVDNVTIKISMIWGLPAKMEA